MSRRRTAVTKSVSAEEASPRRWSTRFMFQAFFCVILFCVVVVV